MASDASKKKDIGWNYGLHPYPMNDCKETRKQAFEKWDGKPDELVACVGGGSDAMVLFHEFVDDKDNWLTEVEAVGFGIDSGKYAAALLKSEGIDWSAAWSKKYVLGLDLSGGYIRCTSIFN